VNTPTSSNFSYIQAWLHIQLASSVHPLVLLSRSVVALLIVGSLLFSAKVQFFGASSDHSTSSRVNSQALMMGNYTLIIVLTILLFLRVNTTSFFF
jgi:hypothetical protein